MKQSGREGNGKGKLREKRKELLFMIQNMNIDKIELIKGREGDGEDREKSLLIPFQVSRVLIKED